MLAPRRPSPVLLFTGRDGGDKRAAMTIDDYQLRAKRHRLGHPFGSFSGSIFTGSSPVIRTAWLWLPSHSFGEPHLAWAENPFSNMPQGIGSDAL